MPIVTVIDKPSMAIGQSGDSSSQAAAKARAIAIVTGGTQQTGNTQSNQVASQNNISPEEVSAVRTASNQEQGGTNEDTSATEATETKAEEPALSTQYAVLARKEKALRSQQVAFQNAQKAKEAEWTAREAKIRAEYDNRSADPSKYISIDDLKRSPYQKLTDLGVTYDDLTTQALQAQSPEYNTIRQMREELRQELAQVKAEQQEIRKSSENQQAQAYQQALKQIEAEAKQLVFTDPAFDTIKNTRSVKQVVKLIESTFKDTGELLSVERAAELVEEELIEQGVQYTQLNKIKARLASATQHNAKQQSTESPKQQPVGMKTLTNSVTNTRQLTAKERALLAFKGEKF